MNCCNEYGDCRQGRDCPIRRKSIQFSQEQLERWKREDRNDLLLAVGLSILMAAVCIVGIYWSFA